VFTGQIFKILQNSPFSDPKNHPIMTIFDAFCLQYYALKRYPKELGQNPLKNDRLNIAHKQKSNIERNSLFSPLKTPGNHPPMTIIERIHLRFTKKISLKILSNQMKFH